MEENRGGVNLIFDFSLLEFTGKMTFLHLESCAGPGSELCQPAPCSDAVRGKFFPKVWVNFIPLRLNY